MTGAYSVEGTNLVVTFTGPQTSSALQFPRVVVRPDRSPMPPRATPSSGRSGRVWSPTRATARPCVPRGPVRQPQHDGDLRCRRIDDDRCRFDLDDGPQRRRRVDHDHDRPRRRHHDHHPAGDPAAPGASVCVTVTSPLPIPAGAIPCPVTIPPSADGLPAPPVPPAGGGLPALPVPVPVPPTGGGIPALPVPPSGGGLPTSAASRPRVGSTSASVSRSGWACNPDPDPSDCTHLGDDRPPTPGGGRPATGFEVVVRTRVTASQDDAADRGGTVDEEPSAEVLLEHRRSVAGHRIPVLDAMMRAMDLGWPLVEAVERSTDRGGSAPADGAAVLVRRDTGRSTSSTCSLGPHRGAPPSAGRREGRARALPRRGMSWQRDDLAER